MFCFLPKKNALASQGMLAALLCLLIMLRQGAIPAISAALGCSVALLPALVFQTMFFANREQIVAKKIINNFYLAATLKFLLLVAMFVGCAQWSSIELKLFFPAFLITQTACSGANFFRLRAKATK